MRPEHQGKPSRSVFGEIEACTVPSGKTMIASCALTSSGCPLTRNGRNIHRAIVDLIASIALGETRGRSGKDTFMTSPAGEMVNRA